MHEKMDKGKINLLNRFMNMYGKTERKFLEDITMRDRFNAILPTMIALLPFIIFVTQILLGNFEFDLDNTRSDIQK